MEGILALLRERPEGTTIGELRAFTRLGDKRTQLLLAVLLREGLIRREGRSRLVRYYAEAFDGPSAMRDGERQLVGHLRAQRHGRALASTLRDALGLDGEAFLRLVDAATVDGLVHRGGAGVALWLELAGET